VLVLLKQLQPYLSSQNLSTAPPVQKGGYTVKGSPYGHKPQFQQDQFIAGQADQILNKHNAGGSAAEVDALNSILNNINVQTKNQQYGDGRLPPI